MCELKLYLSMMTMDNISNIGSCHLCSILLTMTLLLRSLLQLLQLDCLIIERKLNQNCLITEPDEALFVFDVSYHLFNSRYYKISKRTVWWPRLPYILQCHRSCVNRYPSPIQHRLADALQCIVLFWFHNLLHYYRFKFTIVIVTECVVSPLYANVRREL